MIRRRRAGAAGCRRLRVQRSSYRTAPGHRRSHLRPKASLAAAATGA